MFTLRSRLLFGNTFHHSPQILIRELSILLTSIFPPETSKYATRMLFTLQLWYIFFHSSRHWYENQLFLWKPTHITSSTSSPFPWNDVHIWKMKWLSLSGIPKRTNYQLPFHQSASLTFEFLVERQFWIQVDQCPNMRSFVVRQQAMSSFCVFYVSLGDLPPLFRIQRFKMLRTSEIVHKFPSDLTWLHSLFGLQEIIFLQI